MASSTQRSESVSTFADDSDDTGDPTPSGSVSRRVAAPAALVAVRLASFDEAALTAELSVGRETVTAALDPAVDPAVMKTALARGERVIAAEEAAGWVILGALRTAATPGVDEGKEFSIKARRIAVVGTDEVSFVSGSASLVMRAYGHVETIAQDITTRASQVHKLVGRMIRLN
jgi:hypothetical protein